MAKDVDVVLRCLHLGTGQIRKLSFQICPVPIWKECLHFCPVPKWKVESFQRGKAAEGRGKMERLKGKGCGITVVKGKGDNKRSVVRLLCI